MNRQRCTVFLLFIALNCCVAVPIALSQNLTEDWVQKAAGPLVENHVVDGLSIGYIEGEQWGIVHLGSASQAGEKPSNSTIYELGSVSKLFTSLLLADAVIRDEINLYAAADVANPAGIRLPSLDGRSIKWIDLSTHRAGLPRVPGNLPLTDLVNPYRDYDSKKAAEFLNQYELPRPPGQSQEYSNFGVSVLGYLIAQKVGKPYEQLLQERIAEPLKMTDCTVSLSDDQTKRLATPHNKFGSPTSLWTWQDLPGAGGVHATMRDMMRFAKAQLNPPRGTLGEAIDLAWNQHTEADESGSAMGLGWMIAGDGQTRWHNGETGGFAAALFINRKLKSAVVVLCNTFAADQIDKLAIQLIQKTAGLEVNPDSNEKAAAQAKIEPASSNASDHNSDKLAIDTNLRNRLMGRYQVTHFIFTVTDIDGHLMVGITDQPTQEVFPDSPARWSYHGIKATLEFKLGKTGPASSVVLHQNGIDQTAKRIGDVKPQPASDPDADKLAIDSNLRSRLAGRYQMMPDFIFTVTDDNGHLMVGATNQPTQEVFPDSPTRWSSHGVDATMEFQLPKTGPAKSLILHHNGANQLARRMD